MALHPVEHSVEPPEQRISSPGADSPAELSEKPKRSFWVALGFALQIAYPMVAYFALRYLPHRLAVLCLLAVLAPSIVPRLRKLNRQAMRSLAVVPLLSGGLLLLSLALDSQGLVMLVPFAINVGFLGLFGATLFGETPMIERFARLSDSDLSPAERRWCRIWTWIWASFFAVNAITIGTLAWLGELAWWTTYTGLVCYLIMGNLFGIEYTFRKYRFGRFGDHFVDQKLQQLFQRLKGQSRT